MKNIQQNHSDLIKDKLHKLNTNVYEYYKNISIFTVSDLYYSFTNHINKLETIILELTNKIRIIKKNGDNIDVLYWITIRSIINEYIWSITAPFITFISINKKMLIKYSHKLPIDKINKELWLYIIEYPSSIIIDKVYMLRSELLFLDD